MNNLNSELTIRGESVQRIYDFFINKKLIVNRRYQRKLVWSIEEKQAFIDSITKGFPIPLILFAEKQEDSDKKFEIIDGMQRLDAITSFINGEFPINGDYFNLETMASTKLLLDKNLITQKKPVLSQDLCVQIVNYLLPISTYRETSSENIDEIFRRINSNGRQLSNQELRQAGALGKFSDLVRNISSKIRGDVSSKDILNLNEMKKISLKNGIEYSEYGIDIDQIFWIKNGIIRKSQIRDSKDEEIVADILASIILPTAQGASGSILDELYSKSSKRFEEVEAELLKKSPSIIVNDFIKTFDEINKILESSNKNFVKLLFSSSKEKVSRYYVVLFLTIYNLTIKQNMMISNYNGLIKKLNNLYDKTITLSKGGGTWSAKEKIEAIDLTTALITIFFKKNTSNNNPAYDSWITELENILTLSKTENVLYDFKQGFYNLQTKSLDQNNFSKIIKTLTAIANVGKNSTGYVLIGISDNISSSNFFEKIFSEKNIKFREFYINGIDNEAKINYKNLDTYFTKITQLIKAEPISESFSNYLTSNLKLINYKGKSILVFKIESQSEPVMYDNLFFDREGCNTVQVPMSRIIDLSKKFLVN